MHLHVQIKVVQLTSKSTEQKKIESHCITDMLALTSESILLQHRLCPLKLEFFMVFIDCSIFWQIEFIKHAI